MRVGKYEINNPLRPLKEMMIDEFNAKTPGEQAYQMTFLCIALVFLIAVMLFTAWSTSQYMNYTENRLNEINENLGRSYALTLPVQNCSCQQPGTSSANPSSPAGYKS